MFMCIGKDLIADFNLLYYSIGKYRYTERNSAIFP